MFSSGWIRSGCGGRCVSQSCMRWVWNRVVPVLRASRGRGRPPNGGSGSDSARSDRKPTGTRSPSPASKDDHREHRILCRPIFPAIAMECIRSARGTRRVLSLGGSGVINRPGRFDSWRGSSADGEWMRAMLARFVEQVAANRLVGPSVAQRSGGGGSGITVLPTGITLSFFGPWSPGSLPAPETCRQASISRVV